MARADLSSDSTVLIADMDQEAVGAVVFGPEELLRLFVRPDRWGTGVADALHAAVLNSLRSAAIRCVVYGSSRRTREPGGSTRRGDGSSTGGGAPHLSHLIPHRWGTPSR